MSQTEAKSDARPVKVPLAMDTDLESKIEDARKVTKLSKQDVMRKGIEFGLPILIRRMTAPVTAEDTTAAATS